MPCTRARGGGGGDEGEEKEERGKGGGGLVSRKAKKLVQEREGVRGF